MVSQPGIVAVETVKGQEFAGIVTPTSSWIAPQWVRKIPVCVQFELLQILSSDTHCAWASFVTHNVTNNTRMNKWFLSLVIVYCFKKVVLTIKAFSFAYQLIPVISSKEIITSIGK